MISFSSNDTEQANLVLARHIPGGDPSVLLAGHLDDLKDRRSGRNDDAGIVSFLFSTAADYAAVAIAGRIVNGNAAHMTDLLRVSSRFSYLYYASDAHRVSGEDAYVHIFPLLKMIASGDLEAVEKTAALFSLPVEKGHPDTVLLCNSVYALLGKLKDPSSVLSKLPDKRSTKFFSGMYRCIDAAAQRNEAGFLEGIRELLKGNARQSSHSVMENLVCIEAHAMAGLWKIRNGSFPAALSSLGLPWDRDFHEAVQSASKGIRADFSPVSPVLQRWLTLLPETADADELIEELKEGFFKRFARIMNGGWRNSK